MSRPTDNATEQAALRLTPALCARIPRPVRDPGPAAGLGYLTEALALRRYYRELEARHREELGDEDMFSSHRPPGRG